MLRAFGLVGFGDEDRVGAGVPSEGILHHERNSGKAGIARSKARAAMPPYSTSAYVSWRSLLADFSP